jgi:hypothetical protein
LSTQPSKEVENAKRWIGLVETAVSKTLETSKSVVNQVLVRVCNQGLSDAAFGVYGNVHTFSGMGVNSEVSADEIHGIQVQVKELLDQIQRAMRQIEAIKQYDPVAAAVERGTVSLSSLNLTYSQLAKMASICNSLMGFLATRYSNAKKREEGPQMASAHGGTNIQA